MKKTALIVTTVFCLIACNEKKKDQTQIGTVRDTTLTTGLVLLNLGTNDYVTAALRRMIKDTLQMTIVDSTKGKIIQEKRRGLDTSYQIWWANPVLDSLRQPLKSKMDPRLDSVNFLWFQINKESVIHDYNKSWKQ